MTESASSPFDAAFALPALAPGVRATVAIPARDEAALLPEALGALCRQSDPASFEVVVFANNCADESAAIARSFARTDGPRLHVIECDLPPGSDHVGTARKLLLDAVAARFLEAGCPRGIVASTDADTIVAGDWLERTFAEMEDLDALATHVELGPDERAALPPATRRLYALENAFRSAWAELESSIDPLPEDPWPRHRSFVAAGFAVTAAAYRRAGGLAPLRALEDRTFASALRRVDARLRHSLQVRASTSGRRCARVAGGFATLVNHLHAQGGSGGSFMVEDPREIEAEALCRAAVRRGWRGLRNADDDRAVAAALGVEARIWRAALDRSQPFGRNFERVTGLAANGRPVYGLVPVEESLAGLRASLAARNAARPTRVRTASGAG